MTTLAFHSEGDGDWVSADGRFRISRVEGRDWIVNEGDEAGPAETAVLNRLLGVYGTKREAVAALAGELNGE